MSSASGDDVSGEADWMRSGLNLDPRSSPQTEERPRRSFFATLPGILFAAGAGVVGLSVVATVTFVAARPSGNDIGLGGEPSASSHTTHETSLPTPSSEDTGQIEPSYVAEVLSTTSVADDVIPLMSDCANGSAVSCFRLGDLLVQQCFQGVGTSCDLLYRVTGRSTAYETYGATCGGRFDPSNAETCNQLDLSVPPQPPPPP